MTTAKRRKVSTTLPDCLRPECKSFHQSPVCYLIKSHHLIKSHCLAGVLLFTEERLLVLDKYSFRGRTRLHISLRLTSHFHSLGFSSRVIHHHRRDSALRLDSGMRETKENLDVSNPSFRVRFSFFFFSLTAV